MTGPSALQLFHAGTGRDARGRALAEILAWDDARLEAVHDYIQWLFPLPEPSVFNPDAPLLTAADRAAFRASEPLRAGIRAALQRMLRFYRLDGDAAAADAAADAERPWLTPDNHNFLRLTRILRCLHVVGLRAEAAELLGRLETLCADGGSRIIGPRTLDFWRAAVR